MTQQALVDMRSNLGKMPNLMPIGLLIHTEPGIAFANRQACGPAEPKQFSKRGAGGTAVQKSAARDDLRSGLTRLPRAAHGNFSGRNTLTGLIITRSP